MIYRRRPFIQRRYSYINPEPSLMTGSMGNQDPLTLKGIGKIPLPNEAEDDPASSRDMRRSFLPSFLSNIQVDDIILLGLIFILFQEGVEDEILLVLLVYIFIT